MWEEGLKSSGFDPEYIKTPNKRLQKLMALAGISAGGSRVFHFLGENETMTASRYASTLEKFVAGNLL